MDWLQCFSYFWRKFFGRFVKRAFFVSPGGFWSQRLFSNIFWLWFFFGIRIGFFWKFGKKVWLRWRIIILRVQPSVLRKFFLRRISSFCNISAASSSFCLELWVVCKKSFDAKRRGRTLQQHQHPYFWEIIFLSQKVTLH